MEGSASEPAMGSFDYTLPGGHTSVGLGLTGHAKKVLYGHTSKDDGKCSSRINLIIKQAGKVPGPGKYVAHEDWKMGQTNKFCSSSRDYKQMHKNPPPHHYEAKDFATTQSMGARSMTSNHPGIQFGKIRGGKRRSYLDGATKLGAATPGPGAHNPVQPSATTSKSVAWSNSAKKSASQKVKVPDIAPNHYKIDYSRNEKTPMNYSISKGKSLNFIDKYTRETYVLVHSEGAKPSKKDAPGPAHYDMQNFDLDKTSRGTFHLQLRGLTRAPASGFF